MPRTRKPLKLTKAQRAALTRTIADFPESERREIYAPLHAARIASVGANEVNDLIWALTDLLSEAGVGLPPQVGEDTYRYACRRIDAEAGRAAT
ncbi:hypothetical protein [Planktothrix phage Pra-JY27]|nr:hypothetical protein [Planktothrix phage Pag-Yong1]WEV89277.1 hypothetical protein [Synechococcus phage MinM2]